MALLKCNVGRELSVFCLMALGMRACVCAAQTQPATKSQYLVFAGTYTNQGSKGIYAYRFAATNGKLTPLGLAAASSNPSFLIEHPNHRFLYAVSENGNADDTVSAFAIASQTGKLTPLNAVSSHGSAPCHLAFDRTGRWLAVANYASGSVAVLPVLADGKLGEAAAMVQHHGASVNPARQNGPHAHCVLFSPNNHFLLVADLGLDSIFVYRFDAGSGSILANDPPSAAVASVAPGAGVRHLVFHPNGKVLFAINEMASSVTAFLFDAAKGSLGDFQTVSTLPEGFSGASTAAEIAINQAGTMLYASNRGHDSIALLAIDPDRFRLSPMEFVPMMGKSPRSFALDPSGAFMVVAYQDSNALSVFRVHPATGQLVPTGGLIRATTPSCVVFVPAAAR